MTLNSWDYFKENFYYVNPWHIAKVLRDIVKVEFPIHRDELFKRASVLIGFKSIGNNIIKAFKEAEKLGVESAKTYFIIKDDFFYSFKPKEILIRNRNCDNISKNICYISPEEIDKAVNIILKQNFALSIRALANEALKLFGFVRGTQKLQDEMIEQIQKLVEKRIIKKQGENIIL